MQIIIQCHAVARSTPAQPLIWRHLFSRFDPDPCCSKLTTTLSFQANHHALVKNCCKKPPNERHPPKRKLTRNNGKICYMIWIQGGGGFKRFICNRQYKTVYHDKLPMRKLDLCDTLSFGVLILSKEWTVLWTSTIGLGFWKLNFWL